MTVQLTPNGVQQLIRKTETADAQNFSPTLQIINIKKVASAKPQSQQQLNQNSNNVDRFRLVLSDGTAYVQGMLATQVNYLVTQRTVVENSVVELKDYIINVVQNRPVVIVLSMANLSNLNHKVGDPVDVLALAKSSNSNSSYSNNNYNENRNNDSNGSSYSGNNSMNKPPPPIYGQQQQQQSNNMPPKNNYNSYNSTATTRNTNNRYLSSKPPVQPMSNASSSMFTPISKLNLYATRWTIRARITNKSAIRTWSNARGEGKLFSMDLLDDSGTDIRATFFKEAVDRFYDTLQVDHVYTLSGGKLKVANVQWNTCASQFEITFDQNSEIHQVGDDGSISQQVFEFVSIASLDSVEVNSTQGGGSPGGITLVDVIGIVKSVSPVGTVLSRRTQQELFKSDLTIVDDSAAEVNLTVWGEEAKAAESKFANQPIVAFKKVRLSDYNGRSLGTTNGSCILLNPRIPEAERVRKWWMSSGSRGSVSIKSLSASGGSSGRKDSFDNRKSVSAIKMENLGHSADGKPDWISFKGTFTFLKKEKEGGPWYTACANAEEPCKNRVKVTQTNDGSWICDRCSQQRPNCVRRYIFSACVTDDTSTTWVSLFNEQAENLLTSASGSSENLTADYMYDRCFENSDFEFFENAFHKANYTDWVMKCRVKSEPLGEEMRVKTTLYGLYPMDYVEESRELLKAIKAM